MDIASTASIGLGLNATGAAIRKQQAAFDQQAEQTVADSLAAADPTSASDSSDLVGDVVGLKTDQIVNSILYSVFRAQADQQREAADLLKTSRG
jgi:hypothetical protein